VLVITYFTALCPDEDFTTVLHSSAFAGACYTTQQCQGSSDLGSTVILSGKLLWCVRDMFIHFVYLKYQYNEPLYALN
jgi:hypothetical protein